MIREFDNILGGLEICSERHNLDGEPNINYLNRIHYPSNEIFYKDETIIYQISEVVGANIGIIVVPGYKRGEEYAKYRSWRALRVKVEPVKEGDKLEIKGILKKVTNLKYNVFFW